MIALVVGIAPCVPGFLGTIGAVEVAPVWISLYHYAWFISFGISAVCYTVADEARTVAGPARPTASVGSDVEF